MPGTFINKRFIFGLISLCCCQFLTAQRYGLSIEAGYHFGIQTRNANDAPFPSSTSYSLGNGITRQLMFHVYPDSSNWYFSAGLHHLGGFASVVASDGNSISEGKDFKGQRLTVNSLRALAQLTYSFHVRRYDINLSGGLVLPLLSNMKEETYISDSGMLSRTNASVKNYGSLGFAGGLGVSTNVTKKISLFCNAGLFLLNSKVKSRKIESYSDSRGRTMEEIYPETGQREFLYRKDVNEIRNNKTVLPDLYDKNKPTDKLSYTRSYSSAGIQIGIRFLF